MSNIFEELLKLLKNECSYYKELAKLAFQKKEVIIDNNIEELTELLEEDSKILDNIESLEVKRKKATSSLADSYNVNIDELNFEKIIGLAAPEFKEQLKEIKGELLAVIEELHDQNEQNRLLINEAMKLNNFSLNLMMKMLEPESKTYNPKQENQNKNRVIHLIDRKG